MMFAPAQIGEIKIKSYEEAETEWEISYWSKALDRIFKFTRLKSPVFTFSNASWYFQLEYGENDDMMAILNFSLKCKNDCSSAVQLTYGLKKQDGNVEERGNVIWKENNAVKYFLANIGSEFATSDVLTIKCTLKREIPQPTGTDQSKFKKLIKLRTLSSNFRSLFANKENCDKTLLVQEKEHKAHGAVLVARSSVFAAMLKHDTLEKQTGVITIPDCDSDTFHQFLEFLYCGKLDEVSFCSAIRLYETSEKYDVQELKTFCMDYLVKSVTAENFRQVVILADKYGDARLFATVQDLFNKNLIKILDTSDWECLLKHNYGLAKELLKGMATKFNELDFAVKNTKTKGNFKKSIFCNENFTNVT